MVCLILAIEFALDVKSFLILGLNHRLTEIAQQMLNVCKKEFEEVSHLLHTQSSFIVCLEHVIGFV